MKKVSLARKKPKRSPRGISLARIRALAAAKHRKKHEQLIAALLAASPSSRAAALVTVFERHPEAFGAILAFPAHREQIRTRIAQLEALDAGSLAALLYSTMPRTAESRRTILALFKDPEYVKRYGPLTDNQIRHAIYRKGSSPSAVPEVPEALLNFPKKPGRS